MLGETLPSITKDMDTYTYRLPLGVCAGIAPFNFPAMIPLWMFPMGMVCGNTYLMKPSERVPGCTMMLAKLLQDAGAPDGTLNIIHGQHDGMKLLLLWWFWPNNYILYYCIVEPFISEVVEQFRSLVLKALKILTSLSTRRFKMLNAQLLKICVGMEKYPFRVQ